MRSFCSMVGVLTDGDCNQSRSVSSSSMTTAGFGAEVAFQSWMSGCTSGPEGRPADVDGEESGEQENAGPERREPSRVANGEVHRVGQVGPGATSRLIQRLHEEIVLGASRQQKIVQTVPHD